MDKIIWVDIETTGLDYEIDSILEIAVVVTDYRFQRIDSYHREVQPPSGYYISEWAKRTHTDNYLLQYLRDKPLIEEVDKELADWASESIMVKGKYPIAGNSVYFDKRFVEDKLPMFNTYLGKTVIDVSGIAKVLDNWGLVDKDKVIKTHQHRALPDILESIDELRYYIHEIR